VVKQVATFAVGLTWDYLAVGLGTLYDHALIPTFTFISSPLSIHLNPALLLGGTTCLTSPGVRGTAYLQLHPGALVNTQDRGTFYSMPAQWKRPQVRATSAAA
jgi:hypothetical protein